MSALLQPILILEIASVIVIATAVIIDVLKIDIRVATVRVIGAVVAAIVEIIARIVVIDAASYWERVPPKRKMPLVPTGASAVVVSAAIIRAATMSAMHGSSTAVPAADAQQ
jgi:hypothetical protein